MPTFTNQATLSYNDRVTGSNIVTGELVEVLAANKTAVPAVYGSDDTVVYIISIVNSGTVPYAGITVTDNLGAYPVGGITAVPLEYEAGSIRYFQNGVLQPAPTVSDESPLTITGITVPAGGNVQLVYAARTAGSAPLEAGGTIVNTAVVSGAGLSTPITVSETVNAREEAMLTISKSIFPDTVTENGQLTYTFVIQNTGNTPAAATDNLIVRDTFDPILNNITVQLDGETLTEGADYTYNEATGEFATVISRITVPAASYTQNPDTGIWEILPGVAVLHVTGTV